MQCIATVEIGQALIVKHIICNVHSIAHILFYIYQQDEIE